MWNTVYADSNSVTPCGTLEEDFWWFADQCAGPLIAWCQTIWEIYPGISTNFIDIIYLQKKILLGDSEAVGSGMTIIARVSELGVRQTRALGEAYATTHLDAIITSDLKRAHATAVALLDGQPYPKPPFKVDRDLREQNFGDAEGQSWQIRRVPNKSLSDHFRDGQYPILFDRYEKFPKGESLNELAARAERAIDQLVLKPYLPHAISSDGQDVHIAVVSHGLCISEMVPALLKRSDGGAPAKDYKGLMNTAWTRVRVQAKPGAEIPQVTDGFENLPPLVVTVTDVNQHEHITNVKRQKGIIEHDPKQRGIHEFFGGGGVKEPVEALEHAESNAVDEVRVEERN